MWPHASGSWRLKCLSLQDPFGQQGAQGEEGAYDELNAPEYSTDEFRMFHFKASGAACMRTVCFEAE